MKIVFFEVEDWEMPILQKQFPEAILTHDKPDTHNIEQYKDAEIVSCFIYSQLKKDIIDAIPGLKMIATRSTGFDHIDVAYAKSKGIIVSNVPEYGSRTVAEHTFALILALTRRMYQSVAKTRLLDFDRADIRGIDIFNKTIGIIGLGKIGIETLKIAKGFGMNVLVYTRTRNEELAHEHGFTYADLNELLLKSDIISLHIPYSKATHHIINKDNIKYFKRGSYLINTSRGGLIETEAIILALENNVLHGVGLDVLENEAKLEEEIEILTKSYKENVDLKTLVLEHILLSHPKVIITPHNAFNSKEALERIIYTTMDNIQGFMTNKAQNTL